MDCCLTLVYSYSSKKLIFFNIHIVPENPIYILCQRYFLCLLLLILIGCDDEPGATDVITPPISIDAISVSPDEVLFTQAVGQKDTLIIFSIEASVNNGQNNIDTVPQFILEDLEANEVIAEGELSQPEGANTGDKYIASFETTLSTTTVSNWRLNVFLFDQRGEGNRIETTIPIRGFSNNPPQILSISSPDTVNRPQSGEQPFSITAKVTDEDGQTTIQSVTVELINPDDVSTGIFNMRDDGSSDSGDQVASDSVYTVTFSVNADSRAGIFDLLFLAQDRAGLESDTLERQIVIE